MATSTETDLFILAVEDDPIYAETLEMTLVELGYHNFSIVDNAAAALKIFREKDPDILLADIEINGPMNGIELALIVLSIRRVPTVFLTAHSDNATFQQAKETRPAAYMVKPYHATNLQAAIELAIENETGLQQSEVLPKADVLFVKYNSRLIKISISDILFIEVDEKYCYIHTAVKKHTVNIRLKNLLDMLPAGAFVQIHRSYAVRLDAIEEINTDRNTLKILRTEMPIGRTFRENFFTKLKTI